MDSSLEDAVAHALMRWATAIIASGLLIMSWPAECQVLLQTSKIKIAIPRLYGASQAVSNNGQLGSSTTEGAFQFEMPDGAPLMHNYSFEGLPDIPGDETTYPVVVNGLTSSTTDKVDVPERQLANNFINFNSDRQKITYNPFLGGGGTVTIDNKVPGREYLIKHFALLPSTRQDGRLSAFIMCGANIDPTASISRSVCYGTFYVEDLELVMHIRFPRQQMPKLADICHETLKLIEDWKSK